MLPLVSHDGVCQLFNDDTQRRRLHPDPVDVTDRPKVARMAERVVVDRNDASSRSISARENLHEIEIDRRDQNAHVRSVGGHAPQRPGFRDTRAEGASMPIGREGAFDPSPTRWIRLDGQKRRVQGDRRNIHFRPIRAHCIQPCVSPFGRERLVGEGGGQSRLGIGPQG